MKILFIDPVHPSLWKALSKKNFECVEGYALSKDETQQIIGDFDGIVIRSRFKIDSAFLDACKDLKFIARYG